MNYFLNQAAESRPEAVPLGLAACILKMEARTIAQLAQEADGSKGGVTPVTFDALLGIKRKFATISQLATELELKRGATLNSLKASELSPVLPVVANFQPIYVRADAI